VTGESVLLSWKTRIILSMDSAFCTKRGQQAVTHLTVVVSAAAEFLP
jgi:hypothetical protein